LQKLLEVARGHGLEPRNTTGRKKHESGIPNAMTCKASGVKSIYICHDPTGAKVQERAEKYIQTSNPGNIITTSYYRISAVV
jgi:hypothetical protein